MKKLLFRKLLLDYLNFFYSFDKFEYNYLVFQAVNYLDIMIEDGRDYIVYIKYSLLSFQKFSANCFRLFFFLVYFT